MTCRVARLFYDRSHMDRLFCSECGSANLEMCSTISKIQGPYLCRICAQSKITGGVGLETGGRDLIPRSIGLSRPEDRSTT